MIIPARNEEQNISNTLHSIWGQTIQPQKIIVINDGSTDKTVDVATDYDCKVVTYPEKHPNWVARKELAKVFNFGLKELDNDKLNYVLILGADHIISKDYVESLWKKMEENNNVVASGSIGDEFAVTPRGSGRLINYKWWKSLGLRYPVNYGYESYLIMKSMQMGYEKGYYPEIKSETQRKTAVTYKPIMYFQYGQAYRALGYPRHYVILRSAILVKKMKILSSAYFLCGYVFSKKPRYEKELRDFVNKRYIITWSNLNKERVLEYIERFRKS